MSNTAAVSPLIGASPITHIGHSLDLGSIFDEMNADVNIVGISSSCNVFADQERIDIANKQWNIGNNTPRVEFTVVDNVGQTIKLAFDRLPLGQKNLIIICGQDRRDFAIGIKKSLEAGTVKEMESFKWDSISIEYPLDPTRSHNLSGTKMREAARDENLFVFQRHLGTMFNKEESIAHMKRIKTAIDEKKLKIKRY